MSIVSTHTEVNYTASDTLVLSKIWSLFAEHYTVGLVAINMPQISVQLEFCTPS